MCFSWSLAAEGDRCAADSLRPRIPAHGTEGLAPSTGYYHPASQDGRYVRALMPKKCRLAATTRLALAEGDVMCPAAHKAGKCRSGSGPGLPSLKRSLRLSSLTNPPYCRHLQKRLKDQKRKDPRGSFSLLVLQTLAVDELQLVTSVLHVILHALA